MSVRSKELAERLKKFNDEVIDFVEKCTEPDWLKVCTWEEWSVGVTARHIAAGHYEAMDMARMIIAGEKLPELTREGLNQAANQHAEEHADCTKEEVLEVLRESSKRMIDFVAGLDDAELDRTGYMALIGKTTTEKFIENIVLMAGGRHFSGMKAAAA